MHFLHTTSIMRAVISLGLLVVICIAYEIAAADSPNSWRKISEELPSAFNYKAFLQRYKKSYKPLEETSRARLFYLRSIDIFKSNVLYTTKKKSHYLHQNRYIDLLPGELDQILLVSDVDLAPLKESERSPDTPANEFMAGNNHKSISEIRGTTSKSAMSMMSQFRRKHSEAKRNQGEAEKHSDSFATLEEYPKVNPSSLLNELVKQPRLIDEMSKYITINQQTGDPESGERKLKPKKSATMKEPSTKADDQGFTLKKRSSGAIPDKYRFRSMYTDILMDDFLGVLEPYPTWVSDEEEEPEGPSLASGFMDSLRSFWDAFLIAGDDEILRNDAEKAKLVEESGKSGPLIDDHSSQKNGIEYNIDWRENGCVSRVKDQGKCNSCYAFAALDLLEYIYCRQTGVSTEFSAQYLIDCGSDHQLEGCRGGKLTNVEKFIQSRGLQKDSLYPYSASEQTCKYQNGEAANVLKPEIRTWAMFSSYRDWYKWLPSSPLIVGINMPTDFLVYGGGVHDGLGCVPKMGHAMLLVGAGKEDGKLFWLLKNSLSEEWGEKGYFRLSRDAPIKCFNSLFVARVAFN